MKKIELRKQNLELASRISSRFGLSNPAARILAARTFDDDQTLERFLEPTLREGLPSPEKLKNLPLAVSRIASAVHAQEKIALMCDFDVDGLTGGSQLLHFLRAIGALCKVFVPDRFEHGYGLHTALIDQAVQEGFQLLITIDFGTSNHIELDYARRLGLEVIVVDHHKLVDQPPCEIFVNPQQVGCGFAEGSLCASGLVWYLIVALQRELGSKAPVDPKTYLDLACIGTICDMVPLQGANRVIARRGLEVLNQNLRLGLRTLRELTGQQKDLNCGSVSFTIGPRINAAGRLAHGSLVVELLTTQDSLRAKKLARRLDQLNRDRQRVEERVRKEAEEVVVSWGGLPSSLVVWNEDFHTGVIGIVAQRLVERFYRPSIVLGKDREVFKGSVRGVKGFNVIEALTKVSDLLEKFGGHEGAGGLSVASDQLHELRHAFSLEADRQLGKTPPSPTVQADTEVSAKELDLSLCEELKRFEPHGVGNPGPILYMKNVKVKKVEVLKDAHLKAHLQVGERSMDALMWRTISHPALVQGETIQLACKPQINHFGGSASVQLILQAVEKE